MNNPLVSVNMVVYNGGQFISDAIQSILNQTYSNFELIIVDDGSTDKTLVEIRNFIDPRIKLIKHKKNHGVVIARNTALKASEGVYIAILDADDISPPNRLEIELRFLEENPEFGLIGGLAELIDRNGEKKNRIQSLSLSPEETKVYLLFKNCFTHSTVMYKKELLKNFMFDKKLSTSEDYDVIVKISSDYKTKNLDKVLAQYRLHNNNITRSTELINRNNRKIIIHQLSQLGIEVNNKDINIHLLLAKQLQHFDLQLILDMVDWLDRLNVANKKENYFPKEAFYSRISGYWFNLMNNTEVYNYKLIQKYFNSPIRKNSDKSTIDGIKFIIKCILSRKFVTNKR